MASAIPLSCACAAIAPQSSAISPLIGNSRFENRLGRSVGLEPFFQLVALLACGQETRDFADLTQSEHA